MRARTSCSEDLVLVDTAVAIGPATRPRQPLRFASPRATILLFIVQLLPVPREAHTGHRRYLLRDTSWPWVSV
jgi:hypothetical protein